jgi:hypothetical protein
MKNIDNANNMAYNVDVRKEVTGWVRPTSTSVWMKI